MSLSIANPQENVPAGAGAGAAAPEPKKQLQVYFGGQGIPWCKGAFTVNTPKCAATQLVEHAALRQLAGTRLVLYRLSPVVSMSAPMATLPLHQQEVLRAAVCTSTVLIFSPRSEPPALDDPVLLTFVEFAEGNETILVDGYLTSLRAMQIHAAAFQQHAMHPPAAIAAARDALVAAAAAGAASFGAATAAPPLMDTRAADVEAEADDAGDTVTRSLAVAVAPAAPASVPPAAAAGGPPALPPYTPATHRLFVLLDLDKTLLLSDADCRVDQRHLFVPDTDIGGKMAVTDEGFRHRMMLRPGAHTFLRRLMAVAEVGVVTAGDLHYARAAVGTANERAWATGSPDESLPALPDATTAILPNGLTPVRQGLPDVRIPLTHVFSVRHQPKHALPKTFARALPFVPLLHASGAPVPVLAVDDDPFAWDQSCRHQVLPVSPFQPTNNSPACLLHLAEVIERAAAEYFGGTPLAAPVTPVAAVTPPALPHVQPLAANAAAAAVAEPALAEEMDFGATSDNMEF
jgi:hypothetical protein